MAHNDSLYLGFDLSTQQLKCIAIDSSLRLVHEAKVEFDADLSEYGIVKGVLVNEAEGEVFASPAMWISAIQLVLDRLQAAHLDFSRVRGLSGAGMQHGTVFWSNDAERILDSLDPSKTLVEQLQPGVKGERRGAFAHPFSPNWQDASTQRQCELFDVELGGPEALATATGSSAHHRFSGPQIMRYREKYPAHYDQTDRISLVSSFLASVFLGKIAPMDISDVTGMNLWDIQRVCWHEDLLALTAGTSSANELKRKLGSVCIEGGAQLGRISPYFVQRYGFSAEAQVMPFTGDNPATILALPLRPADAMVSLGTSTTFLMSTEEYKPDPAYHFMNHPTTPGLYMFMLCYKNGGLAREHVRDSINALHGNQTTDWSAFDEAALSASPLAATRSGDQRLGLYFPRPEIVPNVPSGQWRYTYNPDTQQMKSIHASPVPEDARVIIESQMLSLRLRSQKLVHSSIDQATGNELPPQPRRVYLVGGGSANAAIAKISGEVLGSRDGVFKLDIGGNACALGGAYRSIWACERTGDQSFENFIGAKWDESKFVKRVANGYQAGVFETYGTALAGFEKMEKLVVEQSRQ